ncbi:MAG TPA: M56 family metallopeptidase [Rhodothermales bacterium]|nr:M56 family metallopeptidase [Rhodothermales bacterium]
MPPLDFSLLALKASLILAATAGLAWALRRASASLRHLVWAAGLGAVLVLPLAALVVPRVNVPVLPAPVEVKTDGAPVQAPPADAAKPAPLATVQAPPAAVAAPQPAVPSTPTQKSRWAEMRAALPQTTMGWIGLVWAVGAGLILVRYLMGLMRLVYWSRRATLVTDPAWLSLAHTLAGQLGLHRGVTLLRGHGPHVPMTWGVLRPVIWIPEDATDWTEERRVVVLAHELAHIRRRDALFAWLGQVALALHWFNPLAHVAVRRLRQEREHACDDLVLALGTPSTTYADHLLAIVRSLGESSTPSLAFAMARRSQFEGRLLAILDPRASRSRPRLLSVVAALAVTLTGVALLAAMQPAFKVTAAPKGSVLSLSGQVSLPRIPDDTTRQALREIARRYRISERLAGQIVRAAQAERVPVAVAFELVDRQSHFDARRVSARGAIGLTQILPSTARLVRPGTTRADLFDVDTNLRAGFRYLRRMLVEQDGDVEAAFTAYHTGERRVGALGDDEEEFPKGDDEGAAKDAPIGRDDPLAELVGMIGSDGDRANLILTYMGQAPMTPARAEQVFAAVRVVQSSGDRANVYLHLLQSGLNPSTQARLFGELRTGLSNGDAANVLLSALARYGLGSPATDAFFDATDALGSDGDKANVLLAAIQRASGSASVMHRLLLSVREIDSDGDKTNVLLSAASVGVTGSNVPVFLDVARTINSDGDKANVLIAAARFAAKGTYRSRFLDVARTIRSEGDRANVLRAAGSQLSSSEAKDDGDTTTLYGSGTDEAGRPVQYRINARNVRLAASGDAIEAITLGGYFSYEETCDTQRRRVVVRPGADGLAYTFMVDGAVRPLDGAARAWIRHGVARTARSTSGQRQI